MSSYLHDHNYNKSKMCGKHKKNKDIRSKELINKIKYNLKLNRADTALHFIEEYLSYNPDNNYVLGYKAMALCKLNRIEEATDLLKELIDKNDISKRDKIFVMSQYASILSTTDISLAIYYYEKIIEESDHLELIARGRLSALYTNIKNYDEALSVLEVSGFNNSFLNTKRATVYSASGDYAKAMSALRRKEYNKGYDIQENLQDEYIKQDEDYIKGHIYFKQGLYDEALEYLTKANTNKNRIIYFKANIDIARVLILKGNREEAIAICEETKKQCDSEFYLRILDEIIAKSYAKINDYKKAEECYKNIETDERYKQINLGKLELLKGDFAKAEEYLSVLEGNVDDLFVGVGDFYRLILVKLKLKKYDETLEIIEKIEQHSQIIEKEGLKHELDRIKIFIKKCKKETLKRDNLSYSERQIVSYSEEEALEHILDHHVYNGPRTKFNENIKVEELFKEVKK